MYCHRCGTRLPDDSLYCLHCGVRLTVEHLAPRNDSHATQSATKTDALMTEQAVLSLPPIFSSSELPPTPHETPVSRERRRRKKHRPWWVKARDRVLERLGR